LDFWRKNNLGSRNLFPKKEPQVLSETNGKPLIEPPAAVVSLQDSFAKVAEVAKPAVVNISAVQITKVQSDPSQFFYGDPEEFFYRFFGANLRTLRVNTNSGRKEPARVF